MINKMAWELNHGQMEQSTKVNMSMAKKKDKENLYGQMVLCIKAPLSKTISMVMEITVGLMAGYTLVNGSTIEWKEKESLHGVMAGNTMVNI